MHQRPQLGSQGAVCQATGGCLRVGEGLDDNHFFQRDSVTGVIPAACAASTTLIPSRTCPSMIDAYHMDRAALLLGIPFVLELDMPPTCRQQSPTQGPVPPASGR